MLIKIFKFTLIVFIGILGVAVLFFTYANYSVNQRFKKKYAVALPSVHIKYDSAI